ncbi:hypothetical protein FQN49_001388 [Arthroderma sp. PD_2]|nr:hypothetical protein FQN49_001388 [Arthroderma sp. PD_2]
MIPHILVRLLALSVVAQGAVIKRWLNGSKPTGPVDPDAAPSCTYWVNAVESTDKCVDIVGYFGITEDEFNEFNPSLNGDCNTIQPGHSYCVMADPVPTTTTSSITSTSSSSSSVTTGTTTSSTTSPTSTGPSST